MIFWVACAMQAFCQGSQAAEAIIQNELRLGGSAMCSTLTKRGKLRSEPLAPGACQLPQIWPAHQHAAI